MEISQKIIDYAIWYYLKYYPSKAKLRRKLNEKFGVKSENGKKYGGIGNEEIDYIINEKLKNIVQEDEVINSKIRNYKAKGKSQLYIKQKLYERGENRELIEKYLSEAFVEGELENLEKEYTKLKLMNIDKKKIFERLVRKGFRYDDIKRIVE